MYLCTPDWLEVRNKKCSYFWCVYGWSEGKEISVPRFLFYLPWSCLKRHCWKYIDENNAVRASKIRMSCSYAYPALSYPKRIFFMKKNLWTKQEKTGGKIIYCRGGVIYLFRGRNYNHRSRPRYPLMLWKPQTPVYPRLVQRVPDGLTLEEASVMRKKGRDLTPICKLGMLTPSIVVQTGCHFIY